MEKIGLKYGLLTAAALIAYFFLMKLLGLVHIIQLRFLNGIIMAVAIVLALRAYRQLMDGHVPYFKGLGTGVITAVVGSVIFAAFMVVYVKTAGESMVEILSAERFFGERIASTPGVVVFSVLLLEGVISGFMIAFIAMQWFKDRQHKVPGAP